MQKGRSHSKETEYMFKIQKLHRIPGKNKKNLSMGGRGNNCILRCEQFIHALKIITEKWHALKIITEKWPLISHYTTFLTNFEACIVDNKMFSFNKTVESGSYCNGESKRKINCSKIAHQVRLDPPQNGGGQQFARV